MDEDAPRYANLRDYAQLLRRQWPLILLPVILVVVAALAYSLHERPTYAAQAQVLIQDETQQLGLLGTPVTTTGPSLGSPATVAQTINTPALARAVKRKLHTRLSRAALMGDVSLSVNATTGLLDVTATAPTAVFAARLANAYAGRIALARTASVRRRLAAAAHALQGRLRQLSPSASGDGAERAALQDEISRLDFLEATSTPGQVALAATVPGSPASPKPLRDAGLGALAGLLIGLIAAFVRDALDRRLRSPAEISDALGLRLLGQVRAGTPGAGANPVTGGGSDPADADTFRVLRQNIELLAAKDSGNVVLVTSALPEEGRSTVAASLALAAAAAGRRTLLVEADVRRPGLASRFATRSAPGLIDYLAGALEPEDVTRPVAAPGSAAHNGNGHPDGNGNGDGGSAAARLALVPAGYPREAAAELLSSPRMRTLLTDLVSEYDLVVLDCAPLLPVADTLALLGLADAVVVCARSGWTTREQLRAARRALTRMPAAAGGVVVTGVHRSGAAAETGLRGHRYEPADPMAV